MESPSVNHLADNNLFLGVSASMPLFSLYFSSTGPSVTVNVLGHIVGRFWVTPEVAWQAEDLEGGFSHVPRGFQLCSKRY